MGLYELDMGIFITLIWEDLGSLADYRQVTFALILSDN